MKKNIFYYIIMAVFGIGVTLIAFQYKKDKNKNEISEFRLLERKGAAAQSPEWMNIRQNVSNLMKQVEKDPGHVKSMLALIAIYLHESRVTGNHSYYNNAAMQCVNTILKTDPSNFEALSFKGMILLSEHRFTEGLAIAGKAKEINPYNSFVYGLLVDGYVESGNYEAAVEHSDKMMSIRPDIRSYSRVAYLREIHGDNEGAIEAMKLAVDAGPPGDEGTEWARTQLGKLYELSGKIESAKSQYEISLHYRPGYPYALAGLGRIAASKKEYQKAVVYYKTAALVINDFSIKDEIGEVYLLKGEIDSAALVFQEILGEMVESHGHSVIEESHEHHADLELAHAWLSVNNYKKALEHALIEYNRRPENIDVNETVAWVYYKKRDYAKALPYIEVALKTNCRNPALLCKAGLIYAKSGDKSRAELTLREALKNNPNIPAALKAESMNVLQNL
jgi:tetratricopeptide (TPR) repeat protein